jgi:glycerol uptake facilitator-like aquaporin
MSARNASIRDTDDESRYSVDLNNAQNQASSPTSVNPVLQSTPSKIVWEKRILLAKAAFGEFLCTFMFIFIGTATAFNYTFEANANSTSLALRLALCTGFASVALVYSFADVSGANFNPAVSFATFVTGKIDFLKLLMYWAAQLIGSSLAIMVLVIIFPGTDAAHRVLVTRGQDSNLWNAFCMEFILTFILVYVIFATAFDKIEDSENNKAEIDIEEGLLDDGEAAAAHENASQKKRTRPKLTVYTTSGTSKGAFAPIAIGFTIGFLNLMGGTVSGGCYNPARAFGPALLAMKWTDQWLYWVADLAGGAFAGYVQMILAHNRDTDFFVLIRPCLNLIRGRKN